MKKEVFKKCGHPKTTENIYIKGDGYIRCKICKDNYNVSEDAYKAAARYRKSTKGKKSHIVRASKYREKVYADPEKRERYKAQGKERQKTYVESRKPFSDPRKMKGHPLDAKRIVVLSDIQFPFEDPNAVELALQFTEKWKPDAVILNGDILDCYACSDFDRDPLKTDTTLEEMWKLEQFLKRIGRIKSIQGQKYVKLKYLGGNHEDRWRRKIWRDSRSAGGLSPIIEALMHGLGVDDLDPDESFRKAFRITENGFEYYPYGHYITLAEENLIVTHGFAVSMHSGYTAKRHFDRLGKSCVIGHSHRQGSYLVSHLWNPKGAWESGCLCDLNPEYVHFPNWVQGFVLISVDGDRFHVDQLPILPGYKIQYGGQICKL